MEAHSEQNHGKTCCGKDNLLLSFKQGSQQYSLYFNQVRTTQRKLQTK